jgi:signal transduction histidine kinase
MQGRHIQLLIERSREDSQMAADIERLIGLDRTKFANFIIDYTWWDELANFVKKPDRQWAADNLDTSFDACRTDAMWLYDRSLRLKYATFKPGSKADRRLPFAPEVLRERMASSPYLHTFEATHDGIVEIRGGRLHRSNDPNRTGPYTGYLVARHAWTETDNKDLGKLTGCSVRLVAGGGGARHSEAPRGLAAFSFTIPLKNHADQVIAQLQFDGVSRPAEVLAETESRDRWLLVAFAAVLYVGLALSLMRWVSQPLAAISHALAANRTDPLPAVEARKDEFGVVAGNLRAFFEQKAQLEREIAERKRVEMALRASEERLQALAEDLQRSNRELQDFASVASHDLQEPLRKISAFGGRLKAKFGEALPADGQDYLERMMNAVERMSRLIEDLLTYSRVTTRAKPFEPLDLNIVVREVLGDLETRIQQTGGTVEVGELPTIEADPTQMRQIFQNLIGNALKFRREGVPPVVRVSAEIIQTEDGPRCQIVVADNGIGFDEQYSERIFRVFERLHGREQYEGTGVGLAIVKKIAERHGGSVVAHGVLNEGATFTVTLPLRHPEIKTPEAPSQS